MYSGIESVMKLIAHGSMISIEIRNEYDVFDDAYAVSPFASAPAICGTSTVANERLSARGIL